MAFWSYPIMQRLSIRFDDPDLAIDWPIKDPNLLILSEKDKRLPYLKDLKEEDLL